MLRLLQHFRNPMFIMFMVRGKVDLSVMCRHFVNANNTFEVF